MSDLSEFLSPLKEIANAAGQAILEVYESPAPIDVDNKADDSPVTKADLAAHKVIEKGLTELSEQYPILSEEGGIPEYEERKNWSRYWLVDPLDGTKEFINRNGEFTVNIALIENGEAVLGMVYVPVTDVYYWGIKDEGSYKQQNNVIQTLSISPLTYDKVLKVVGSRRHGAEALDALLEKLGPKFKGYELLSMGSSLKICALAEGSADWYPRLALTSEWDTAAAHAVLGCAGGNILDEQLEPLRYNQKESLLNPFFHAFGDNNFDWKRLLEA